MSLPDGVFMNLNLLWWWISCWRKFGMSWPQGYRVTFSTFISDQVHDLQRVHNKWLQVWWTIRCWAHQVWRQFYQYRSVLNQSCIEEPEHLAWLSCEYWFSVLWASWLTGQMVEYHSNGHRQIWHHLLICWSLIHWGNLHWHWHGCDQSWLQLSNLMQLPWSREGERHNIYA